MMRRALAALALAACGGGGDAPGADAAVDAAPPRETVTEVQPLAAGELVEGIMHGGATDHAVIHLASATPTIDWNLHGHNNGGTQMLYEELAKMAVDYRFVPASNGDWYLLIRNGGTVNIDVDVRVELYGEMTWRWQ